MAKTMRNINFDDDILTAIDKVANEQGMNRSQYLNWYFGALFGLRQPPVPPAPLKSKGKGGRE